jgi:pimeloyl-ACP methyl ester carboxylesterase
VGEPHPADGRPRRRVTNRHQETAVTTASRNTRFPGEHWTSFQFFDSEVMDDQFKHQLTQMFYGASDLGECLEVAAKIENENEEDWLREWSLLAASLEERGASAVKAGHRETAASTYLRAATYWRGSLIHNAFPDDPRTRDNAIAAYRCWDRYLELSGYPGEALQIPYEGSFLPAYLYRSPVAKGDAPLLIFFQGRDAWPEDTRWVYDNAIKRGYHALAVQGPGQGMAIRVNGLPFRHDWENVITPVVDVAVQLEGVDTDRVGLMGLSFGGYLAPRAAAYEKRLKVCVANPGVLNWGESIRTNLPPQLSEAYAQGPEAFEAVITQMRQHSGLVDWFIRDSVWKHGVSNAYELMGEFDKCDLTDVAGLIEADTLVMDGVEENFSAQQAQKLYDALTCKKELMLFDPSTTAQLHCQNGATGTAGEYLFDWLDGRL